MHGCAISALSAILLLGTALISGAAQAGDEALQQLAAYVERTRLTIPTADPAGAQATELLDNAELWQHFDRAVLAGPPAPTLPTKTDHHPTTDGLTELLDLLHHWPARQASLTFSQRLQAALKLRNAALTWTRDAQHRQDLVQTKTMSTLVPLLVSLSELPDDQFWLEGTSRLQRHPAARDLELETFNPIDSWLRYLVMSRVMNQVSTIYRALGAAYAGEADLERPTLPAPRHWAWDWRGTDRGLCLMPQSVHESIAHLTEALCVPPL